MNFYMLCAVGLVIGSFAPSQAKVHEIKTQAHYNKVFKGEKPMITMYSGAHCGPCKMMKPHFKNVSENHPDIEFCIIDTSNPVLKKLSKQWNIRGLPTVICSNKGERILTEASGGLESDEIEQLVTKFRDALKKSEPKKKVEPKKEKKEAKKMPLEKSQNKKPAAKGCPVH